MAMANMNLIGVFVTKLWPVQTLACGGGGVRRRRRRRRRRNQKHNTREIFKFRGYNYRLINIWGGGGGGQYMRLPRLDYCISLI